MRETPSTRCSPTTRTWTRAGGGYLRLVKCDPSSRSVSVKTYSPYLDSYLTDPSNEFTLENVDLG